MATYRRKPVTFVRGSGMKLWDDVGTEYLDFVAGIAVTALGHAHPAVAEALSEQASRLVHVSNLYYTEPMAELAAKLCTLLGWPDGRVFFANSGAEANECAIKLSRKWGKARSGRHELIAAFGSFHGRTLETLAATGQPAKWASFTPLPPGYKHVPYDDIDSLTKAVDDATCGIMLEPVQGEGGVVVPSDGYLPGVRSLCDDKDLLFIADEVQTGIGRTGEWFGFQHSGAVPDVITLAKALGNGLPIGVCVARGDAADALGPGDHATTMGGGPAICAASLAVLRTIEEEDLVASSRRIGRYLVEALKTMAGDHEVVSEIRGAGLLVAVQLAHDAASQVVDACLERGLLVNEVSPSAIRLCPPLIVSEADCDAAVGILDEALHRAGTRDPRGGAS